ncbi:MAG TPA: AraC family transcriptional regulator [Burkholderiales bacterium]|jgi:transcriptional regulator GlxA family with amidase domain|nr:AraC family transcriptional regulator [Burkholderiales bacterium]
MFEERTGTTDVDGATGAERYPLAPRGIRRALDYIHANLGNGLRLEEMAAAARMSVFHFSRTFRKATGTGPHRYLLEARVARVKARLRSGGASLATIAEETGFSDQSHMSKVFRRFTGMSPKAFRGGPCRTGGRPRARFGSRADRLAELPA